MQPSVKETIENLTAEAGFCEYKLVPSDHIIFNKIVRDLCDEEIKEHAIHSWSLPPVVGTYEECLEQCKQYPWAFLVSAVSMTHDIQDFQAWMDADAVLPVPTRKKCADIQRPYCTQRKDMEYIS